MFTVFVSEDIETQIMISTAPHIIINIPPIQIYTHNSHNSINKVTSILYISSENFSFPIYFPILQTEEFEFPFTSNDLPIYCVQCTMQ